MEYSVNNMKKWLSAKKKEERHECIDRLFARDAVASIMLVALIYRYAVELKNMASELRLSEYKKLSRALQANINIWNQTMIDVLNVESIRHIDSMLDLLVEEQEKNLFQLYISCKNEVDKRSKKNDSELIAMAWRILLLVRELDFWFNKHLSGRYYGLSGIFDELRRIMDDWCGGANVDTSKLKNTELCLSIFDGAMERIELDYTYKAS